MKQRGVVPIVAVLGWTLAAFSASAQPTRWTAEQWREDLAFLHDRIQTTHKNPYHTTPKEAMDTAVAELHDRIPELTDFQIAFAMQKIVASIGDGHSRLGYGSKELTNQFPFYAWYFEDGLYIYGAKDESLIGSRIVFVEGHSVDETMEAFVPYMNRDNDMAKLNHLPYLLRTPQTLFALGFSDDPNRATFQLIDPSGRAVDHAFTGVPEDEFFAWANALRPSEDAPLYEQRNEERYWFKELEGHDALYMQFSQVQHREDRHFSQFARDVTEYIDEHDLKCLIIDVRMNGGGDGNIVNHFIRHISKHDVINQEGHLYVITGRRTYSAALMFTVRMERRTHALIAGEPGAGKPNSYSETGPYTLPNSGLEGSLSALFHQESDPDDHRPWVDVDIPASTTYADYAAKRDPVLEAVLEHWNKVQDDEKPRRKRRM